MPSVNPVLTNSNAHSSVPSTQHYNLQSDYIQCDIDELEDRLERLESRRDRLNPDSLHYDEIQEEIDMLQDRIDELEFDSFSDDLDLYGSQDRYIDFDTSHVYYDDDDW